MREHSVANRTAGVAILSALAYCWELGKFADKQMLQACKEVYNNRTILAEEHITVASKAYGKAVAYFEAAMSMIDNGR